MSTDNVDQTLEGFGLGGQVSSCFSLYQFHQKIIKYNCMKIWCENILCVAKKTKIEYKFDPKNTTMVEKFEYECNLYMRKLILNNNILIC